MSPTPSARAAIDREEGAEFAPRFSADGLLTCVTVDARSGEVLMVAHMNAEALDKTLSSRNHALLVALAPKPVAQGRHVRPDPEARGVARRLRSGRAAGARVTVGGDGGACHTGRRSCFYRRIEKDRRRPAPGAARENVKRMRVSDCVTHNDNAGAPLTNRRAGAR